METKKIWWLKAIENAYEPEIIDNLTWWSEKPNFESLAKAIGIEFKGDDNILSIVNIHQGQSRRINNYDYYLVQVEEAK